MSGNERYNDADADAAKALNVMAVEHDDDHL